MVLHDAYEIDDERDRIDFTRVHAWLSETYWSPGITREQVERAARHSSLVVGAYYNNVQACYLRVISDCVRFAYVCDVYVEASHRGKGLAKAMMRFTLAHPEHQHLRRWLLTTRDAHTVYARVGFEPLPTPERWMVYFPAQPESLKP